MGDGVRDLNLRYIKFRFKPDLKSNLTGLFGWFCTLRWGGRRSQEYDGAFKSKIHKVQI